MVADSIMVCVRMCTLCLFPAPENLISPSISYTSGLSAIVTWSPPAVENGLLAGYRLLVTQMPTFDSSNALLLMPSTRTITVPGQTLSYLLDGLLASRDHAVQLESFTAGGSVSTGFVNFTTDEAGTVLTHRFSLDASTAIAAVYLCFLVITSCSHY